MKERDYTFKAVVRTGKEFKNDSEGTTHYDRVQAKDGFEAYDKVVEKYKTEDNYLKGMSIEKE